MDIVLKEGIYLFKNILKIIICAIIVYPILVVMTHLEQTWDGKTTYIAIFVIEILLVGILIFVEIRNSKRK